jgi:PIN domain nuclease of toxin-antitoxin system
MPNAARKVVLDASALLMVLQREPGCKLVESHLGRAVMSAVNLAEVATVLGRRGLSGYSVLADVYKIVPDIRPFDAEQASLTVTLDEKTKAFGLSLAARACLALGVSTGYLVLTADPTWLNLDLGVEIEVIQINSVTPLATATGQ